MTAAPWLEDEAVRRARDECVEEGAGRCCGDTEEEGCTAWAACREKADALAEAAYRAGVEAAAR